MLNTLAACPLFQGIPRGELLAYLQSIGAEIAQYAKGEILFSQLDTPQKVMVIIEGSVVISNTSPTGKRNIVAIFDKPGELFGEVLVFLNKQSYDNCAQAALPLQVLEIPKQAFFAPAGSTNTHHAAIMANMMHILAQKAYFLNSRLQVLTRVTLRQKISKLLLLHINPNGEVRLGMSREQMADFLNTTRPSLSRELMKMQAEGLLQINQRVIFVPDTEALERLV